MPELETMFQAQWANGMLPHIRFDPRTKDYFPGPEFWASEDGYGSEDFSGTAALLIDVLPSCAG